MVKSKLNIGILGCAKINQVAVIDAAAEVTDVTISAVASRSERDAIAYALRHNIEKAYGSYNALLSDPDIDVVYNPLPNHLHEQWTIATLEAGKHALVEKPLCANADEARRMNQAANLSPVQLIEAFHYRYHPMAIEILKQVHSGAIGAVKSVDVVLKVSKDLLEPEDIRLSFACAGGSTMDLGAYGINFMRAILGESPTVDSAIPTVVADNIDGAMDIALSFSTGATGTLACSIVNNSIESLVTINGEKGTLQARNPFLPQFGHSLTITKNGEQTKLRFPKTTTYVYQLQAVADYLLKGEPCLTPASDGIDNMIVLDEIYTVAGLKIRGK